MWLVHLRSAASSAGHDGLNAVVDDVGIPRVDIATYQCLSTLPVQVFYDHGFGLSIDPDEWNHVDDVSHDV